MAQITPPASSLVQPGAEVVLAARIANALHLVPLKTLNAIPPVTARAAHSTLPGASVAQLGPEVSVPATIVLALHVVPLNVVTASSRINISDGTTTNRIPILLGNPLEFLNLCRLQRAICVSSITEGIYAHGRSSKWILVELPAVG